MSKIIALDIGDAWTGIALSDPLRILAKPLKTVASGELKEELTKLLKTERISHVVVGHPKTMKGTQSEQTHKVVAMYHDLQTTYPDVTWVLWDERLSSQRASALAKGHTKQDKLHSHAVAAAFILDSYLSFLQQQQNLQDSY